MKFAVRRRDALVARGIALGDDVEHTPIPDLVVGSAHKILDIKRAVATWLHLGRRKLPQRAPDLTGWLWQRALSKHFTHLLLGNSVRLIAHLPDDIRLVTQQPFF